MKAVVATGKTVEEAIERAVKELNTTKDKVETKVLELPSSGFMSLFRSKLAKVEVTLQLDLCDIAADFLKEVCHAMNIDAHIEAKLEDNVLFVELKGDSMGVLIGRRGQTLDSLQYLTSLVVNKESEQYIRVNLDTENYRKKREVTLIELAGKLAHKVEKTRRKIELEPMNPYERRIIHSTLQKNKNVHTYSQGEEPFRKVVIDVKKTS
ncbi:spoIIIJ-associated protein [Alkalibaculum bacchi]|uniref:RNA-binding protein KhpB n=1 Tax=Alkalibaculum bacchi TaxID=645887 RepID=A0A366I319_9FIRM|nr:RNA-binding cell elongation regulator Jag/EloR [Alkalibaculum bacchi]RBP62104.1 spoIIIJ-associated protein [Alkalibaculum bacchi]